MNSERTIGAVFSDLLGEGTALFRSEIRLARAEMSEKIGMMGTGIGMAAAGGLLLFAALLFFLETAVAGLMKAGLEFWLACLIVAAATLVVGAAVSAVLARTHALPAPQ